MPCPDTSGNVNATGAGTIDGLEDTDTLATGEQACKAYFGFLPARTLGMNGNYDPTGTLVDPWSLGYGYAISNVDTSDGEIDLITANNIRDEGFTNVNPDLIICDNSTVDGDQKNCGDAGGNDVITGVAVVIISLGRDNSANSIIQDENQPAFTV